MVTSDNSKKIPLGFRLYPREYEALRDCAAADKRSLSSYVRLALLEKMNLPDEVEA